MNSIPSGNVTFLFTDIEGSTKLSQEFPETLQYALDIHHTLMQDAIESNNGYVFEIIGDAFCSAFQNAEDAVKAAVDAQLNLVNEKWADAVIKVRIGIHSGNAEWNGKTYMGYITLARSARVMSCGYGEQIIISSSTYELCKDKFLKFVPSSQTTVLKIKHEIFFRDLGERRMKDVIQPIRLFQIISPGLREDFPPLKTLDARPNNLPVQLSSFIGREGAMKEVKNLLGQSRLLTIIGTGGCGKTRLAMQTGADMIDEFANGVFITEFAPVSDPSLVMQTLLNSFGVKENQGKSPEELLTEFLNDKEMLLILDNCEHLIHECARLSEILLSRCPKLKIIATSREALNCSGEQTYRLPSLSLPDPSAVNTPEMLTNYESVRLFIERALSVNPNFRVNDSNASALSEICIRLDGIPLAIELAAARVKILSLEKIQERLNDRFNLLSSGKRTALPRQQTLKALIDWSFDLLSDNEKILWGRLSVFNGGWTMDAAEEICSDGKIRKNEILHLLSQLAEKSIIIYDEGKERYRILETMKQYGEDKLKETDNAEVILEKHFEYFLNFSETAEFNLTGAKAKFWLDNLETEHNNIQSAIEWSLNKGFKNRSAKLAGVMGNFWKIRGHCSLGNQLLEKILINTHGISKSVLGKAMDVSGMLFLNQGEHEKAYKIHSESLGLFRELEDKNSTAVSLYNIGDVEYSRGNYEKAKKLYEESLEINMEIENDTGISNNLNCLGNVAWNLADYEQAQKFYEDALSMWRKIGDKNGIAVSLNGLGNVFSIRGKYDQALIYYNESLDYRRDLGDKNGISSSLNNIGNIAFYIGDHELTRKSFEESLLLRREIGNKFGITTSLINLGVAESHIGNYEDAKIFFEESISLAREIGDKNGIGFSLFGLGEIFYSMKIYDKAQSYYEECINLRLEMGDKGGVALVLIRFAIMFCDSKEYSQAVKLFGTVDTILNTTGRIFEPSETKLQEIKLDELREKLSDEKFNEFFEEGKRLTMEQAVDIALSKIQ